MTDSSGPGRAAGDAAPRRRLARVAPKTLVEQVAESIIQAAAEGHFLPGDRVVEADIARELGVSRVPVREALRMLESQGIVVSLPYRGMHMMEVSAERLDQILEVRLELERLAVRLVLRRRARGDGLLGGLDHEVGLMQKAARERDSYAIATHDTAFHRELCRLSGNEVLLRTWEPLARQLTIIFGLSSQQKPMESIVVEHVELLQALERGDPQELDRLMEVHILDYTREVDLEGFVARQRG